MRLLTTARMPSCHPPGYSRWLTQRQGSVRAPHGRVNGNVCINVLPLESQGALPRGRIVPAHADSWVAGTRP